MRLMNPKKLLMYELSMKWDKWIQSLIKALVKCMDEIKESRNVIKLWAKYINEINESKVWLKH
jgi:hypothetical protein